MREMSIPAAGQQQAKLPTDFSSAFILKQKKLSQLNRSLRILSAVAFSSGTLALATLALSLYTADWVRTEERMPNRNRTVLFGPNKSPEYLPKLTFSGLFDLCFTAPGETNYSCIKIDFFPNEEYLPDQNDSTMAIAHVVIHSAYFFFSALVVVSVAQILGIAEMCVKKRKILTFLSGIIFVSAGLLLFVGMVYYISLLKSEIGTKLSPASPLSPPRMTCSYGLSFLLLVVSFLSCEAAGISAVVLFLRHHQRRFVRGQRSCRQTHLLQRRKTHTETVNVCPKHFPRSRHRSSSRSIIAHYHRRVRPLKEEESSTLVPQCNYCGFMLYPHLVDAKKVQGDCYNTGSFGRIAEDTYFLQNFMT